MKAQNNTSLKDRDLRQNAAILNPSQNSQGSTSLSKRSRLLMRKEDSFSSMRLQYQKISQSDSITICDNEQYYIDEDNLDVYQIASQIMESIQLLNYQKEDIQSLRSQFISKIDKYIQMDDIFPEAKQEIGQILLQDGLFHEMWGKILYISNKIPIFSYYYQKYSNKLRYNISNFQSTFNLYDSLSQINISKEKINTLDQQQRNNKEYNNKAQLQRQLMNYSESEEKMTIISSQKDNKSQIFKNCNNNYYSNKDRLRLIGHIAINKKRIQAEMVCYFLNLKQAFKWKQIEIVKVLQFYSANKKELLIVEAHVEQYNQLLNKKVIDYIPKILIGVYGYVNFGQLLRIKQQYGQIHALILQDQNINLGIWLKANGYLDDHHK